MKGIRGAEMGQGVVGDNQIPGLASQGGFHGLSRFHSLAGYLVTGPTQMAKKQLGIIFKVFNEQDAQ
jgi:hypothetical protein